MFQEYEKGALTQGTPIENVTLNSTKENQSKETDQHE